MNLQQLEYIVAVDAWRHFVTAAEKSFVTQATLSMMIKKLEDELEVKIFDRSRQPVQPTAIGRQIIDQAKIVLNDVKRMKESIEEERGSVKGELRIGMIPTLTPYLLPLFITSFLKKYPLVKLKISEHTTDDIVQRLQDHHLDAGILATPLNKPPLSEEPLFYEQFVVYASSKEKLKKKKYLLSEDIDVNRLWLLEEGHCLRTQVVNLCALKKREKEVHQLDLEAGSIETLKKIVEANQGITILPELAMRDLTVKQKMNIRYFKSPAPVREISIVTVKHFPKKKLIAALRGEILHHIPDGMKTKTKKKKIPIKAG